MEFIEENIKRESITICTNALALLSRLRILLLILTGYKVVSIQETDPYFWQGSFSKPGFKTYHLEKLNKES